jgi:hypothetical protein
LKTVFRLPRASMVVPGRGILPDQARASRPGCRPAPATLQSGLFIARAARS